jgi:hypothetical protein
MMILNERRPFLSPEINKEFIPKIKIKYPIGKEMHMFET